MPMIQRVLTWCQQVSGYDGPGRRDAMEMVEKGRTEGGLGSAFDLGYRRGYADAALYLAEWIEEEDE